MVFGVLVGVPLGVNVVLDVPHVVLRVRHLPGQDTGLACLGLVLLAIWGGNS